MMKTAALSPQAAAPTGVGPEPCSSSPPSAAASPARPPLKPHPSSPPPPKPHPSSPPPPKTHPSSPPPPRPQTLHGSHPSRPQPPPLTTKSSFPSISPVTPLLPPPLTPSLPPPLIPSSPPFASSSAATSSSALLPSPLNPSSPSLLPTIPPSSPPLPLILPLSSPPLAPTLPPSFTTLPSCPSISLVERLIRTCPVWLQLGMNQERSYSILRRERPGMFLVRRGLDQKTMVLSVRLADLQGESQIQDVTVTEEKSYMHLDRSGLFFENIFKLVSFYCISRDVLPFTLRLPKAIVQATKYEDMEVVSTLGSDFWGSLLNQQWKEGEGDGEAISEGESRDEGRPGACFINPVSLEEHCSLQTTFNSPVARSQSLNCPSQGAPIYKRPPPRPPSAPEPILVLSQGGKPPPNLPSPRAPPSTTKQKEEGKRRISEEEKSDLAKPSVKEAGSRPPPPHPHRAPPIALPRRPSDRRPPDTQTDRLSQDKQTDRPIPDIQIAAHLSPEPTASLICIEEHFTVKKDPEEGTAMETHIDAGHEKSKEVEEETEAEVTKVDTVNERDAGAVQETEGGTEVKRETASETDGDKETERTTDQETGTVQAVCDVSDTVSISSHRKPPPQPVPPPRKKRPSLGQPNIPELCSPTGGKSLSFNNLQRPPPSTPPWSVRLPASGTGGEAKALDVSLYSPEGGAGPSLEHDSYSTSSTEDEGGANSNVGGGNSPNCPNSPKPTVKRTSTIILDKAKSRLSMVNISNVFTGLLSADNKLQKRIVELSRDGSSYLGHLVREHRAFTLETLGKHNSSTEMLQEIRQMMTQLKSYLIQSMELQGLLETSVHTQERLESIVEAALCKSVLKPVREPVYSGLKELHTRTGSLKRLKENQALVLGTTSTDLGVTTSVPETPAMEKISAKLWNLHREYSPQRKIDLLLKTCKIIYESMSVGCPGRAYGADDFLPVLMYVLARTNMAALMLDVEYMMELMDPALQLGEGSYYLTTTYGALEHIKNFDTQPVTRQLSMEVQDSIHRWERRRTLNTACTAQTTVQDFITVSLLEAGSNPKTLGVQASTTAQELCEQCAAKFEVPEPDVYSLSVLVEGKYQVLEPTELPLSIKTRLHHAEPRKEYYFVYRHGNKGQKDADGQPPRPPPPTITEDSLIEI
ncbi:ras and Rab interactor 3 [Osmerus eperlanus]|uniref:ras and Rab interactor 3 n=1 Tax=Osmerus eperlanus TaxID=29151 RepID=UPI002E101EF0